MVTNIEQKHSVRLGPYHRVIDERGRIAFRGTANVDKISQAYIYCDGYWPILVSQSPPDGDFQFNYLARLDGQGRIQLPAEIRNALGIKLPTTVIVNEMIVHGNGLDRYEVHYGHGGYKPTKTEPRGVLQRLSGLFSRLTSSLYH